jgi:NAD(P)-dependent dehydrogenase (short-subunit alcohol dehydrogenase family)
MLSLKDKVAFISGAGSVGGRSRRQGVGSGNATAVLLARQGAGIYGVISGRRLPTLLRP